MFRAFRVRESVRFYRWVLAGRCGLSLRETIKVHPPGDRRRIEVCRKFVSHREELSWSPPFRQQPPAQPPVLTSPSVFTGDRSNAAQPSKAQSRKSPGFAAKESKHSCRWSMGCASWPRLTSTERRSAPVLSPMLAFLRELAPAKKSSNSLGSRQRRRVKDQTWHGST